VAPVYVDGEKTVTLKGGHIAEEFQALVARYVTANYTAGAVRKRPSHGEGAAAKHIPIKAV